MAILVGVLLSLPATASASHSWSNYHWARTQNPFTLTLADHVTTTWDPHLSGASGDWSQSSVLDTAVVPSTTTKNCKAVSGRVDVCNGRYGNNGWLGLSQIWVTGSHITKSTVKVNDTYFSTPTYNIPDARRSVICMEVGHSLGLDHQDGVGDSCMDDLSYDWANIAHPNAHDYAQLATIYNSHTDSSSTVSGSATSASKGPGKARRIGPSLYVEKLGDGRKRFTWVYWKSEAAAERASDTQPPV